MQDDLCGDYRLMDMSDDYQKDEPTEQFIVHTDSVKFYHPIGAKLILHQPTG